MNKEYKILLLLLGYLWLKEINASASRLPETTKTTLLYYDVPMTWNDAVSVCNKRDGILANVEDAVKVSALTEALAATAFPVNSSSAEIWIGLQVLNSTYYWSSCQSANSSALKLETDMPSTNHSKECGVMSISSNLWNLRKCNENRTFFCEVYEECGCSMEKFTKCADLSRTQYVNTTTATLDQCLNLCLDYATNLDQCWSISYYEQQRRCQVNERIGAYTSLCVSGTGVYHYHKNCFAVRKLSGYSGLGGLHNLDESPIVDCEVARNITDLKTNCNFSASNEILATQLVGESTTTSSSTCTCLCSHKNDVISNVTLSDQLLWLRKTLSIDKKETSLVKRSKTSATDDRMSAQGLGYAGGIILVVVIGGVVSLDMSRLFHDIKAGLYRCKMFLSETLARASKRNPTVAKSTSL